MEKKLIFVMVVDSLMRDFLIDFLAINGIYPISVYLDDIEIQLKKYQGKEISQSKMFLITDQFIFENIKTKNLENFKHVFVCSFLKNKNHTNKISFINDFSLNNIKNIINQINEWNLS